MEDSQKTAFLSYKVINFITTNSHINKLWIDTKGTTSGRWSSFFINKNGGKEVFKYVPVLRYRQEERRSLKSVKLSDKTMPLIELIMEKPNSRIKEDFEEIYKKELSSINVPFMVDFPMYLPLSNSTSVATYNFLTPIQTEITRRTELFKKLQPIEGLIPVVTYIPKKHYLGNNNPSVEQHPIKNEAVDLRPFFPKLAFRIYVKGFEGALNDVAANVKEGDIIILDLDKEHHQKSAFTTNYYPKVISIGKKYKCKTIIIRSSINEEITNIGLDHGQPIDEIDNSLLKDYSKLGFSAFGDFAGIKKDKILKGGPGGTAGYIFYYWDTNEFIGFKGRNKKRSEYSDYIVPQVNSSTYFNWYSSNHHKTCPSCKTIIELKKGIGNCNSFAKWKGLAVMHYLQTIEEFL